MKTGTSLVVLSNGSLKSVPLSSVSGEQWETWFGAGAQDSSPAFFYDRVPWLYAGVNLIANAAGSLPKRWTDLNAQPLDAPPTAWAQSFGDLVNAVAGDLLLYGCAYVFRSNNRRGAPTELRRLLPTTVKPEIDGEKGLTHFTRTINGKQTRFELDDLIYVWEPNRTGEIGPGTSRARAALAASGALAGIDTSMSSLFNSGAMRPTIVSFEDPISDAEIAKTESTIKRRLQGVKNAFGFTAISGKMSFQTLGDRPRDLVMPELTESKRQDVATALGIPESLLSSSAANYATSHQDTLNFYDMTVIPVAGRILSAFNSQCFESLGLTVETAEEELEVYQAMQGDQVQALATMFTQRVITVNEFRERVGFAPLEDPAMPEEPPTDPEAPGEDEQALPEPEDNPLDRQQQELRAWARFAAKRLKEGRPLRTFETQHIPPTVKAAIEGQLEGETDVNAVKGVFDSALRWAGYP